MTEEIFGFRGCKMGYAEKKGKRKGRGEEYGKAVSVIRSSFIGLGVSLAFAVVLWFVASAVAYANNDPDSVAGGLGFAAIYISSMAAGFAAVRVNRQSALLCGLLSGGLLALMMFFVSIFFTPSYSSNYPFILSFGMRAAMVLFSVLGAFAGLHRTSRRKRGKKRA